MKKLFFVLLISLSTSLMAGLTPEQVGNKIREACGDDISKFCPSIDTKVPNQINNCLVENKSVISKKCDQVLRELKIYLQGELKK